MAMGIGEAGKPMSEATCYKKLQALAAKGCIDLVDSTRDGTRLRLHLPAEIPGVVLAPAPTSVPDLEELDFFEEAKNREAILRREQGRCFYCLRALDASNWLIEHVRSRPEGDNSYRNVVAACRACNNCKGSTNARDFLRDLYRTGVLSQDDLAARLEGHSIPMPEWRPRRRFAGSVGGAPRSLPQGSRIGTPAALLATRCARRPRVHSVRPTYTRPRPKSPRRETRGRRLVVPPVPEQHRDHPRFRASRRSAYELDDLSTARNWPGVTNRTPS